MSGQRDQAPVLIAGAGIGGLTAALALVARDIPVVVFEQAPQLGEVGAGVQLGPNGTRVLAELGLLEALWQRASVPRGKEIRLWSTGQVWKLFDLGEESVRSYRAPYLFLHRADLHDVLHQALERRAPGSVHLGARVRGYRQDPQGVWLDLGNGRHVRGQALIGADGVHSAVRQQLHGDDRPRFSGIIAWRGIAPTAALPPHLQERVGVNWVGPGRHVIHYPLRGGELINFVGVVERSDWQVESWSVQGDKEECRRDFEGWHADVHTLIDHLDRTFKWALMSREPLPHWSDGRVTLLGDAAHPTLPFLAQGACMAIEDGLVLARCMDENGADVTAALQRYEAARIERTTKVINGSNANADRFHNSALSDPQSAQRYVQTEWQEDKIRQRYDWLFRYDAASIAL